MSRDARFWRNVGIIGLLHLAVLAVLVRWGDRLKKAAPVNIVWMEGGPAAAIAASVEPAPTPAVEDSPPPEPEAKTPEPTPAESNLVLPSPTPSATPEPTPTSTPRPKPSPSPTAKKKKSTPTPTPKPKKKNKNKEVSKKAATPKKEATPKESAAKEKPKSESTSGSGGRATGPGGAAQAGQYGNMLHDRFFSAWEQPTSVVASGARMSALVRVRIQADGRVSSFEIVRSSGNIVVDDSVRAVAKRVTQVDPLPAALGQAGHYDVQINFELNAQ